MAVETCDLALQSHHLLGCWVTFLPLDRAKCAHRYERCCEFIEYVLLARVTDLNDTGALSNNSHTLHVKLPSKKVLIT